MVASRFSTIRRLSDFPREDTVFVGTVRSPVSRGTIESISLPQLPGDYRSISADDIPGSRLISVQGASIPILASGRVAYRGEPVALIVGPDKARVAEAISLTRVRVVEEAADFTFETTDSARVVARQTLERGDVEAALAAATRVVEGDYRIGPQDHYYSEPQGSAAALENGSYVLFSSTQWPFHVRASVADMLDLKKEAVEVRPTLLGSHLDGKLWYPSLLACHAALATMLVRKPALLLLSRPEDFLYTTKRAPVLVSYRAGLGENGLLVALDASIMINTGAYVPFAGQLLERSINAVTGAYACRNLRVMARIIRTDLPPMGAFVGLGTGPVTFAVERLAEDCAAAADQDPSEWRQANLAGRGDSTLGVPLKKAVPYKAISARLLAISDYPRKRSSFELIRKRRADPSSPPGYGIGLAFGHQMPPAAFGRDGWDPPSVELTLSKNSTLTIKTSLIPGSQATAEIWKQKAAAALGLQTGSVVIETPSTATVPDSGPGTLSRSIGVITRLIESAGEGLAARRFREALPISMRKTQRARSASAAPESPIDSAAWGGAVVELELDPVDGSPLVRGVWIVVRAGRILSGDAVIRTLKHDAAVALGLCLGEWLDLSRGPADAQAIHRYRLPRLKDTPKVSVDFIDDDSEPRGIGELAYALVPPAFANALSQALDTPWNSMPIGDFDAIPGGGS